MTDEERIADIEERIGAITTEDETIAFEWLLGEYRRLRDECKILRDLGTDPLDGTSNIDDEELASLRADAARWRWLLRNAPANIATIAWRVKEACEFSDPTKAVDAAIAKERADAEKP